ncbi:MAG: DUF4846 domain-containing protein [Myxococcota bacterium]
MRQVFPPPTGATRVPADPFATSLRQLRVLPPGTPILTHDGREIRRPGRVLDVPLVRGDLQQCADTIIRLRAEWLRDAGHTVRFHATSGDPLPWKRFKNGEYAVAVDNRIRWRTGRTGNWDAYLRAVFTWAGTASLAERDTIAVNGPPQPGHLLVDPGFPGHAVVLLDVATRGDSTFVLIAQGFMPAQSAHVVPGPYEGWWRWEPGVDLPVWSFKGSDLRRFRDPTTE